MHHRDCRSLTATGGDLGVDHSPRRTATTAPRHAIRAGGKAHWTQATGRLGLSPDSALSTFTHQISAPSRLNQPPRDTQLSAGHPACLGSLKVRLVGGEGCSGSAARNLLRNVALATRVNCRRCSGRRTAGATSRGLKLPTREGGGGDARRRRWCCRCLPGSVW